MKNQTDSFPNDPLPPFSWPKEDEAVRQALLAAYADGSWGKYHGPNTTSLADDLRAMHNAEFVLLTSSGTVAVELALRGVGVGEGDEVVLAGYDFPGNFRAIEAVGARPVLVDIDSKSWCLDVAKLEMLVAQQPNDFAKVRAVVVSHLHGGLADIVRLRELSSQHGWAVVEDACQTPGAILENKIAGTWGDVGVMSFGGSKLLTAGRGGAILTNDAQIFQRATIFNDRGNSAFPLSELQAAVLRPQLAKLEEQNEIRANNAQQLRQQTSGVHHLLQPVASPTEGRPCYYKMAWQLDLNSNSRGSSAEAHREPFIQAMQSEGIPIDAGFRGFATRSQRRCRKPGSLKCAQAAANNTLVLHHPVLLEPKQMIARLAEKIEKVTTKFAAQQVLSRSDTQQ